MTIVGILHVHWTLLLLYEPLDKCLHEHTRMDGTETEQMIAGSWQMLLLPHRGVIQHNVSAMYGIISTKCVYHMCQLHRIQMTVKNGKLITSNWRHFRYTTHVYKEINLC